MGYSATTKAFETLKKIENYCIKTTGSSNTWKVNDKEWFFEINQNFQSGGICGSIHACNANMAQEVNTFAINKEGKVLSFPYVPNSVWTNA